jgi:hypothetical protein
MIGFKRFSAQEQGRPVNPDFWKYEVQSVSPEKQFFVTITGTQQTRKQVKEDIERWCELYPAKLPESGGTIHIDLDEARKV